MVVSFLFGSISSTFVFAVVIWTFFAFVLSGAAYRAELKIKPINLKSGDFWGNPRKVALVMAIGSGISLLAVSDIMNFFLFIIIDFDDLVSHIGKMYFVLRSLYQTFIFFLPGFILLIAYISFASHPEEEYLLLSKKVLWFFSGIYNLAGLVMSITTGVISWTFKSVSVFYVIIWMIAALIMSFVAYRKTW